jgi:hypothetical protein
MDNLIKQSYGPAGMDNHELLKLTLKSLLLGGGVYGAARLGKDMYNEFQGPQKPKNELPVVIPQKMANENEMPGAEVPDIPASKHVFPVLSAVGGAGAGFFGASKLYDAVKNHFLEKELKKKQQGYVQTLQQVNQKMGEYPYVEEFLSGVISKLGEITLEKGGTYETDFGTQMGDLWQGAKGWMADKGHEAMEGLKGGAKALGAGVANLGNEAYNSAKSGLGYAANKTELGAAIKAGLILTTLGSGAATYMIAKNMDKKKEEASNQSQIPTDLKLHAVQGQLH